jgi:hypothetical protein
MNRHIEFLPRLVAYHDGTLEAGEHASVKAHVEQCPQCRAILHDWKAVDQGLKALEKQPVVDVKDDVVARIAALPARRRVNIVFQKPYWSMAAAAVLLIFSATFWVQNREQPRPPAPPSSALQAPKGQEFVELPPSASEPTGSAVGEVSKPAPPSQSGMKQPLSRDQMAMDVRPDGEALSSSSPAPDMDRGDAARMRNEQVGVVYGSPSATAVAPFSAEVSGILQQEWPPRLAEAFRIYYRFPDLFEPAIVEVNLLPVFDAEFVAVGYADDDLLEASYDVASARPTRLSPEAAYLVANLRLERAALLARLNNQVRSADAGQRLADLTWQLANITVDQDDVRHAIAAQDAAMRQNPSLGVQATARMAHLRTLVIK